MNEQKRGKTSDQAKACFSTGSITKLFNGHQFTGTWSLDFTAIKHMSVTEAYAIIRTFHIGRFRPSSTDDDNNEPSTIGSARLSLAIFQKGNKGSLTAPRHAKSIAGTALLLKRRELLWNHLRKVGGSRVAHITHSVQEQGTTI